MAKKRYDLITELYAGAVKEVTANPDNWRHFCALPAAITVCLLTSSF